MWNKIWFQNFKSLRNLELDLTSINILAGGNAAGKSSIIQALLLAKSTSETPNKKDIELNGPYTIESISLGIRGELMGCPQF